MKNSVELTGDDATLGRVGHRHTLTIPSIKDSDFGNYTCRAKNIHGESYKVLEVSGKEKRSNYVDLTNFFFNFFIWTKTHKKYESYCALMNLQLFQIVNFEFS